MEFKQWLVICYARHWQITMVCLTLSNNCQEVSWAEDIFGELIRRSRRIWLPAKMADFWHARYRDFIRQSQRPENSRHSLDQSDTNLKPITTWSVTFSRTSSCLIGFILSSHLQGICCPSDLLLWLLWFPFTIFCWKAYYIVIQWDQQICNLLCDIYRFNSTYWDNMYQKVRAGE